MKPPPSLRAGASVAIAAAIVLGVEASDHLDSWYMDFRPQMDIGDLFVWDAGRGPVMLASFNPLTPAELTPQMRLDPDVLYEFKIDTDGDARADLAYKVAVAGQGLEQDITLLRAEGAAARANLPEGEVLVPVSGAPARSSLLGGAWLHLPCHDAEYQRPPGRECPPPLPGPRVIEYPFGVKLFVGARQDPFFFDFSGVESPVALDLRFALSGDGLPTDGTAQNTFGPTNITAIVLEVPELRDTPIGVWATTSRNGAQEDRAGNASITAIFLPNAPPGRNPAEYPWGGDNKQKWNVENPDTDRANWEAAFRYRLVQVQTPGARHAEILDCYLPDILQFDPARPPAGIGCPNGRDLEEDAVTEIIYYLNPTAFPPNRPLATNPQPLSDEFPYAADPIAPPGLEPYPVSLVLAYYNQRTGATLDALAADTIEWISYGDQLPGVDGVYRGRQGVDDYDRRKSAVFRSDRVELLNLRWFDAYVTVLAREHGVDLRSGRPATLLVEHQWRITDSQIASLLERQILLTETP